MYVIKNSDNMFYNGCIFDGDQLTSIVVTKSSGPAFKFKAEKDANVALNKLNIALNNEAVVWVHGENADKTSSELHVEAISSEKLGLY